MDAPAPIPAPDSKRRGGRKRRLYALVLAPILGLLLAEGVLRLTGDPAPDSPYDPYGFSIRASLTGAPMTSHDGPLALELASESLFRLRPGTRSEAFTIDASGFRGKELGPKKAGRLRVALLGASTVFGIGLPSDAATVSARLEARLPNAECVNAGVPWHLCGQQLGRLTTRVLEIDPDVVVWCDGWTDCFDWFDFPPRPHDDYGFNNHVLRLLETKLVEREAAARDPYALLSLGVREVVRDTAIARALARRFSPPPETTGPSPLLASEAAGPESPEAALARAEAYVAMRDRFVRHVSTMRDLCVARNVRFIAVFQPEISCRARPTETEIRILNEKPGYARSFVPIWRKFKKETTEAFARAGLSVDDASNFPELRDAVPACFLDVVHLSAEGADRVAAALAARLD